MALPVTITGLVGNLLTTSQPFISSSGNVYVFGRDSSDTDLLRAFKATDPTSSFSNVGTDVDVQSGGTWPIVAIAAVQISDVIHIVTVVSFDLNNNSIYYHTFNMATDAWVTTNEGVKTNYLAATTDATKAISISARSDGDIIVIYNGSKEASMGSDYDRVKYARREGGTWTIDVALDSGGADHWYASGLVIGSSDRMHFFFVNGDLFDMFQRTLTSANVLETLPSAFDTSITATLLHTVQQGASYDDGGTQRVRYPVYDSTSSTINSAKLDSANAPTVTQDTDITGSTSVTVTQMVSSFSADGTTLWHTFASVTDGDLYTQSNEDDAGWSTPAEFYDDTDGVNGIRTNVYTRGSSVVLAMV